MSVTPICFGMQRAAVSTHQSGDVRSHDLLAEYPFDGAQDRLVEEGAALHDDFITGFLRIAQLDDLIKGIFDDRIGQTLRRCRRCSRLPSVPVSPWNS